MTPAAAPRHPAWLKVRAPGGPGFAATRSAVRALGLHTVCEEARCPNIGECWGHRTATFMLLGGAAHFATTARAVKDMVPDCRVEVLVPDFQGRLASVDTVAEAPIDVFNHNVETVPRLYRRVRPGARYDRSLAVLRRARERGEAYHTKAGLMLGLGEELEELTVVLEDLRAVGCDILTLGQYLRPSADHLPIERYVTPEEFAALKEQALDLGFAHVESGPLVRSSYHAWSHVKT